MKQITKLSALFLSAAMTFTSLPVLATGEDDPVIEDMVTNGLRNEQHSLFVVADQTTTDVEFDLAPENASETMKDIVEITKDRIEKRTKKLKDFAEDDFDERKDDYSCGSGNVTMVIDDQTSATTSDIGELTIKLTSLYSVQHDDEVLDSDLDDYLEWLGDKRFLEFLTGEDDDGYEDWYAPPQKWKGKMLPQKQFDEAEKAKEEGTYDESDYEDYYTSALGEIMKLDPEIDEAFTYDDETGELTSVTLTYKITSLSVDEICENVIKFDEAIPVDADGNKAVIGVEPYRAEKYKEMVGDGEGEGVTLEYFGDAANMTYTGLSGSGMNIVQVAIGEIGVTEVGSTNEVKYNDWFYGSNVSGSSYPWCCAFVSWCADQCGYIDSGIVPKTAGCAAMKSFYESRGRTHSVTDSSYTPQPGDFVIMGSSGHIGIVEKYEDGVLYTIEGNSGSGISDVDNDGGCVARHAYGEGYSQSIVGRWGGGGVYCTPEYPVSASGGNAALICWMYETGGGVYGQYDLWYHGMLSAEGFYNYGAMSTNRGAADQLFNYIKSNSSNFNSQMSGLGGWIDSGKTNMASDFNAWWEGSHSEADNTEMFMLQSAYTWDCYGAPAAQDEFAFMARSEALKAVTMSRSVHRGASGARSMFRACGISESMSDQEIVETVYDYEAANITAGAYTESVRARMPREKQTVLDNYF